MGFADLSLFAPRRPLRPDRVTRYKPKPLNVHVDQCHLIVRVVRGINVFIKEDKV